MNCIHCNRKAIAQKLCNTHYMRERRAGRLKLLEKESPQDFVKNRIKVLENGCWEWQLSKFAGYGRTIRNGKTWPAHAYSYTVFVSSIPDGKQINHKCHNRSCVNPEHLYAGTQKENVQDMNEAGRRNQAFGSRGGNSKLTEELVKQIFVHNGSVKNIAKQFKVSISLIYQIKKKLIWRHIHVE